MFLSMEEIKDMRMDDFLGKSFTCACGRTHRVAIERIIVENKAIFKLPELLNSFGYKKVYLVADTNTYSAAGEQIEKLLNQSGFSCNTHVFNRTEELVPDETAVGELELGIKKDAEVIVAVGTGTINDLCKYISCRLDIPYIICATATSMDGYASDVSALILDNLKTTLSTTMPKAIVADVDVLKRAPKDMLIAGFGDMLGKYSAINDWKLSHLINNEYFCEAISSMVQISLEKCAGDVQGLLNREDEAVKNLMNGLIITGIAISFSGNSRPASGSEHHLSHFWEMMYLFDGKKAVLHGFKVGIGTLATNLMREKLSAQKPDFEAIMEDDASFDLNKWTDDVKRLFRKAAPGIIELNEREKLNDARQRLLRLRKIQENWKAIVEVLKEVPDTRFISNLLSDAGAPVNPKKIGLDQEMVENAVVYAKEVRARYTVLQLLWDLNYLHDSAKYTGNFFFK